MNLKQLCDAVDGIILKNENKSWQDLEINGLSQESQSLQQGDVFFCLTGGKLDGHTFAKQAQTNGAVALVVEREVKVNIPQILVENTRIAMSQAAASFYNNPAEKLKIIAITGTNGKTTTAHMLSSILKKANKKVGVIGTLGIRYDNISINSPLTTPDPIFLHGVFSKMVQSGVEYVVMEASAHALYYHKLFSLKFCACIFTNFTQDHLDFFKTMQNYKSAKIRLFTSDSCPLAIVNGDDETGIDIWRQRNVLQKGKTVLYGLDSPADAFAIITHEKITAMRLLLNLSDELCAVSVSMIGRYNVYNALAAATCAHALNIPISSIAAGLSELCGVSGRLQYIADCRGASVFVDFAHTPDGLEKSLSVLKKYCKGKLVCLFGCGGNRDKSKRAIMGETAAKTCDFCVLTSDNPRYEDPLDILSQIEKGYRRVSNQYVVVPDRKRAIAYALEYLSMGDILLVAGKGGETTQEIMGIKYPFDDNAIIKKYLNHTK